MLSWDQTMIKLVIIYRFLHTQIFILAVAIFKIEKVLLIKLILYEKLSAWVNVRLCTYFSLKFILPALLEFNELSHRSLCSKTLIF